MVDACPSLLDSLSSQGSDVTYPPENFVSGGGRLSGFIASHSVREILSCELQSMFPRYYQLPECVAVIRPLGIQFSFPETGGSVRLRLCVLGPKCPIKDICYSGMIRVCCLAVCQGVKYLSSNCVSGSGRAPGCWIHRKTVQFGEVLLRRRESCADWP